MRRLSQFIVYKSEPTNFTFGETMKINSISNGYYGWNFRNCRFHYYHTEKAKLLAKN